MRTATMTMKVTLTTAIPTAMVTAAMVRLAAAALTQRTAIERLSRVKNNKDSACKQGVKHAWLNPQLLAPGMQVKRCRFLTFVMQLRVYIMLFMYAFAWEMLAWR